MKGTPPPPRATGTQSVASVGGKRENVRGKTYNNDTIDFVGFLDFRKCFQVVYEIMFYHNPNAKDEDIIMYEYIYIYMYMKYMYDIV